MKLHRCIWILPVAAALLLSHARPASADIAPPPPPEGANITPSSETTQVRMLSETVTIEVANNTIDQPTRAKVTAAFTMRNLGEEDEQMQVRFPLNLLYPYQSDPNTCVYPLAAPEINDFTARVDGRPVAVENTMETLRDEWRDLPPKAIKCWANFPVTFPAGQDVNIEVSYSVAGYHSQETTGQVSFPYVLLTGAAWKDTIGRAEIILKAPFELNGQTLVYTWPENAEVSGSEARWVFEDFEPDQNVEAAIMNPGLWQRILREQNTLAQNPNDGEAWGRLGRWYKEAIMLRRGFREGPAAEEMYELSRAAYEKAVTLLPKDYDWHAGYAELLCWNGWFYGFGDYEAVRDDLVKCLDELRLSLSLNPRQAKALELLEVFTWDSMGNLVEVEGERVTFLALTTTPTAWPTPAPIYTDTPVPTPEPTATREPTATKTPAASPTAVPAEPTEPAAKETPAAVAAQATQEPAQSPAPRGSGRLCGAALLPLIAAALFGLRKMMRG